MTKMSASFGRFADPSTSSKPEVRDLLDRLATLPPGPNMSADFRRDLRTQLVAIAPRVMGTASADELPALDASPQLIRALALANRHITVDVPEAKTKRRRPRMYQVATAAVTMMVALFATLVGLSQNSIPGDSLYGLKRFGEDVHMTFTRGDEAKGRLNLEHSSTRVDEVGDLLSRASALAIDVPGAHGRSVSAAGGINTHTATLIEHTLADAKSEMKTGIVQLTRAATAKHSAAPLQGISAMIGSQLDRLKAIADRLPAGALHDAALSAVQLTEEAQQRSTDISNSASCSCSQNTGSDELGPLPCPHTSTCLQATGPELPTTTPATTGTPGNTSTPATPSAAPATAAPTSAPTALPSPPTPNPTPAGPPTAPTPAPAPPLIVASVSTDKTSYVVGDPITYTLIVANNGGSGGRVSIRDTLPPSVGTSATVSCAPSSGATCGSGLHWAGQSFTDDAFIPADGNVVYRLRAVVLSAADLTNRLDVTVDSCGLLCGGGEFTNGGVAVVTPTPGAIVAPTPTATPIPTPTPTPSPAPTDTPTPVATPTPSPTLSPTPTVTPTLSPSPTPSPTPSPAPTDTPTPTPGGGLIPVLTPTHGGDYCLVTWPGTGTAPVELPIPCSLLSYLGLYPPA